MKCPKCSKVMFDKDMKYFMKRFGYCSWCRSKELGKAGEKGDTEVKKTKK